MMENTLSKSRVIKLASQAALVLGVVVGSGLANAAPVVWDLGCAATPACQNTAYASPHTFQSVGPPPNPFALNAWGYDLGSTAHQLFSKFTSGDPTETGLGLVGAGDLDNEINPGQKIQLRVPFAALYHLVVSSVQAGETFSVFVNSAAGGDGVGSIGGVALFTGGFGVGPNCVGAICTYDINMTGSNLSLTVLGLTGNVLIETFTTVTPTQVPEPVTLALLGLGLLAAGVARRRKV
jgi:PEP-CTERM motif